MNIFTTISRIDQSWWYWYIAAMGFLQLCIPCCVCWAK